MHGYVATRDLLPVLPSDETAKKLKLLAAYIDLIPCTEKDKQFQNAEGVCETTNDGGVQGTSTSFGILSNYSSFYTRLNFNVL